MASMAPDASTADMAIVAAGAVVGNSFFDMIEPPVLQRSGGFMIPMLATLTILQGRLFDVVSTDNIRDRRTLSQFLTDR